jgi:hypothetical protein
MLHHKQIILNLKLQNRIFWILFIFLSAYGLLQLFPVKITSPCPDSGCFVHTVQAEITVNDMIDAAAVKYAKTKWEVLTIRVKLHYLLLRESAYGNTTSCGDQGLSCGPLQFRTPTYTAFRKIMIDRGLVNHMGSRLDLQDSIETCAWAISDGRENNWGPILRGDIKI